MPRPREFERSEALRKAMETFWEKGFESTTIPDLLGSMGISRSSLYETFGDKEKLYSEAMNLYRFEIGSKGLNILRDSKSAREGFRKYFEYTIDNALSGRCAKGCFMANAATAIEAGDEKSLKCLRAGADELEREALRLLERARDAGELSGEKDLRAIARMFLALGYGVAVVAKIRTDRKALSEIAKAALALLS